jgi:hypothetical protein
MHSREKIIIKRKVHNNHIEIKSVRSKVPTRSRKKIYIGKTTTAAAIIITMMV